MVIKLRCCKQILIVSVMYKIGVENVYEDLYKDKQYFDFRNYSEDSKCYNNANNLVVDKMEDETCGVHIKCFVGLKSEI